MSEAKSFYPVYTEILKGELRPALGCTEPIAIAYASAYTTKLLGRCADRFVAHCSGNIIKNVKAVTVPETAGKIGIEPAVLMGAIGGDSDKEMQVLVGCTDEDRKVLNEMLEKDCVEVKLLESPHVLHIIIEAFAGEDHASVEIIDAHTQLGKIELNGKVLHEYTASVQEDHDTAYNQLSVEKIIDYAKNVDIEEIRELLEYQIECNTKISNEGLTNKWGESVGQTITEMSDSLYARMAAAAAAGSDARMNGCSLAVVINSGSGNQGMTITNPIVVYAKEKGVDHDQMLRGLAVGNLIAIHQKRFIGKLSAYCGAVSAGAGAACGAAFLDGADAELISQTVVNAIATVGGMVCDGAKSSCASKIATSVMVALLGYEMAKKGRHFRNGEGLVKKTPEETIQSVGRMAAEGMHSTDVTILNIMIEK